MQDIIFYAFLNIGTSKETNQSLPSFYTVLNQTEMSSVFANGERGAVAPVSALKLYRIGIKRKRAEARESRLDGFGEKHLGGSDNENSYEEKNNRSSSVCLAQNLFFSLPLGITELSGPAGVGKTQLALSLCADCVQPHPQKQGNRRTKNKALFIQLGGSSRFLQIVSRRIEQMLLSRLDTATSTANYRQDSNSSAETTNERVHDCLTRILVHWVCNSEELMEVLRTSLPSLLRKHPTISIVVLDGIANLFRLVDQELLRNDRAKRNPWHDRAVTFFQISNLCKELSSRFEIPFLILNECTCRIQADSKQRQQAVLEPALGLAWAQCANASFFVRRCESTTLSSLQRKNKITNENDDRNNAPEESVCNRILQCLRAPHIATKHSIAKFRIDRSGVVLV